MIRLILLALALVSLLGCTGADNHGGIPRDPYSDNHRYEQRQPNTWQPAPSPYYH